jgi:serine/threonine-protein kinase
MGIVHGALRPRNVRIGDDGSVKLMDVELADLRAELTGSGVVTVEPPPEYLSPEQIRSGTVSEKTDVYTFAVILYEMLCGVPPFRAATAAATLAKHLTEVPVPMRSRRRVVPTPINSMVALALSKRAADRPVIHNLLNSLWQEAHVPATRWKRSTAIVGGALLAASIPVIVSLGLFMPRPPVGSVLPPPTPAAAAAPAPGEPAAASSAIDTATRSVGAAPAVTSVMMPATPVRATTPPASPTSSRAATPERPRRPLAAEAPKDVVREGSSASNDTDDPDPGAVVDWLLERAAARRN